MTPFVEKSVTDPAVEQWASYMPALLTMLACTKGPVLEVGMGHYSTPVLHAICEAECRPLVSLEDNMEWAKEFAHLSSGEGGSHQIVVGPYDELIQRFKQQRFSIAFLDHSPGPRRGSDMSELFNSVDYFVVHDFHDAIAEAFYLLGRFNQTLRVFDKRLPPTAIFGHGEIPKAAIGL